MADQWSAGEKTWSWASSGLAGLAVGWFYVQSLSHCPQVIQQYPIEPGSEWSGPMCVLADSLNDAGPLGALLVAAFAAGIVFVFVDAPIVAWRRSQRRRDAAAG